MVIGFLQKNKIAFILRLHSYLLYRVKIHSSLEHASQKSQGRVEFTDKLYTIF